MFLKSPISENVVCGIPMLVWSFGPEENVAGSPAQNREEITATLFGCPCKLGVAWVSVHSMGRPRSILGP